MQHIHRLVASTALIALSLPAWAVLPQPGLWTIGNELNGQPGRGIQIDRQGGRTIVLSYFGYRKDGSSMFLLAAGEIKDGKTFSANLTEYKNGPVLNGSGSSAQTAEDHGLVTINFDTTTTGTITLPGAPATKFSRFTFEDLQKRLNGPFNVNFTPREGYSGSHSEYSMEVEAKAGQLKLTYSGYLNPDKPKEQTFCTYEGDLVPAGTGFRSRGTESCNNDPVKRTFRFEDFTVSEYGVISARAYYEYQGREFLLLLSGMCVSTDEIVIIASPNCSTQALGLSEDDIKE